MSNLGGDNAKVSTMGKSRIVTPYSYYQGYRNVSALACLREDRKETLINTAIRACIEGESFLSLAAPTTT